MCQLHDNNRGGAHYFTSKHYPLQHSENPKGRLIARTPVSTRTSRTLLSCFQSDSDLFNFIMACLFILPRVNMGRQYQHAELYLDALHHGPFQGCSAISVRLVAVEQPGVVESFLSCRPLGWLPAELRAQRSIEPMHPRLASMQDWHVSIISH